MKKLFGILIMVVILGALATSASAVTTLSQNANVTLASVLSIEFATTTDSTFGSGTIPWTSVDPASSVVYPTGHLTTKSDVGLICKYNGAGSWYAKMNLTTTNLTGKLSRWISQPTNRNTTTATNGSVTGLDSWVVIPAVAATVYTSGLNDSLNTPLGTFIGVNYSLNPTGLATGTAYTGTITYTITTTP